MDVRVLDYIDDRLAASSDFEALDSLIENVKEQQDLLKKQLDDARRDYDSAQKETDNHVETTRQKADAFQKEQAGIDTRLLIATQSETSDEAARKFEASMARLRKLEIATGYVELLREADTLSTECISQLGKSDEAALRPYRKLQQMVTSLQSLQEAAEGAAPHLLDHIFQQAQKLKARIQQSFSSDLEETLKKMNWPKATSTVPMALQDEWERNIERLLDLQRPDLETRDKGVTTRARDDDPPVLLPLEVLIRPLEQRFAYHFSGKRPTNRLDKPEYFLSHIEKIIEGYSEFIQNSIQPLLLKHFRGSNLSLTPAYVDATCAFITALLPMVQRKVLSFASQVTSQPNLLSHLVRQVLDFDKLVEENYAYTPESPSTPWRGLAFFLLDTSGYFQRWLDVERDFALARYSSIIETAESGELDWDSVASDATKPTKAAIRVNDLLETVTDRYRPLSSFSQKMRFLIDIQIAIFDQFHARLHSSLEAYITMTSSLARTMHGISREDQSELQGVKGLDRLCRVFGSAEYLERAMRDWSDDVFFLELWEGLQERAGNRDRISKNLGSLQEIQSKTSSAVGQASGSADAQSGALFDETAEAYRRLRVRSETIIVETLTYNIREALRPYTQINNWAALSSSSAGGSLSAELDAPLSLLTNYLTFLSKALGRVPLRRVGRQVCHSIQSFLWDQLLVRHSFSTAGATQLKADLDALTATIDRYIGAGQASRGMRRLCDGVALLSLPVKSEIPRKQASAAGPADDDDEGAAWDDAAGDSEDGSLAGGAAKAKQMGLFEVERLVFLDNENARHALELVGLESLSEGDARSVLERRVELGS
ncbi:hypothetical protein Q7P37_006878 [Cladosporium fusiforme]